VPRYAAIDIGSNSIRMEAAEVVPGLGTQILASDREVTRLGESVFRTEYVNGEAMKAACTVLARMRELYLKLNVVGVRAVATSAVRDARNQGEFLARASEAVGAPVETISGREEARLIHLGVESVWPQTSKVLIIDIGGGSAEIIAADHANMLEAYSKPLGAVRLMERFLKGDPPTARQLSQMHEYIGEKLDEPVAGLDRGGWERVIATSATAAAIASAVARVPRDKRDALDRIRITTSQVRKLYDKLSTLNLAGRRKTTGIGPRRAEIIVPGLAVLLQFLQEFHIPSFYYSRAGVRDGIIADLAARDVSAQRSRLTLDQRREVKELGRRYGVAPERARRVAEIAQLLFRALQPIHLLPAVCGKLLEAAAYLFDAGHYISAVSHHKHSYYVVANSDIAGFTERERILIAALCRYHRKALPTSLHGVFQALSTEERRVVLGLIPIVRLADNLVRSRDHRIQSIECQLRNGDVELCVHATGDIDLEQWGAERAGEAFEKIYHRKVSVVRARD
jgi:exopolyphosphatase/guanosine-5'-triphosphate,3'-diphosphate pyrophosphatase